MSKRNRAEHPLHGDAEAAPLLKRRAREIQMEVRKGRVRKTVKGHAAQQRLVAEAIEFPGTVELVRQRLKPAHIPNLGLRSLYKAVLALSDERGLFSPEDVARRIATDGAACGAFAMLPLTEIQHGQGCVKTSAEVARTLRAGPAGCEEVDVCAERGEAYRAGVKAGRNERAEEAYEDIGLSHEAGVPAPGEKGSGHKSDCALHNEPAMRSGPCDCGAAGRSNSESPRAERARALLNEPQTDLKAWLREIAYGGAGEKRAADLAAARATGVCEARSFAAEDLRGPYGSGIGDILTGTDVALKREWRAPDDLDSKVLWDQMGKAGVRILTNGASERLDVRTHKDMPWKTIAVRDAKGDAKAIGAWCPTTEDVSAAKDGLNRAFEDGQRSVRADLWSHRGVDGVRLLSNGRMDDVAVLVEGVGWCRAAHRRVGGSANKAKSWNRSIDEQRADLEKAQEDSAPPTQPIGPHVPESAMGVLKGDDGQVLVITVDRTRMRHGDIEKLRAQFPKATVIDVRGAAGITVDR